MFIAPSNRSLSTAINLIRILGMGLAVVILFVLWVTSQVCILIAALLVMAVDIPAPAAQIRPRTGQQEDLILPDPW
jgi:hypothetical protein